MVSFSLLAARGGSGWFSDSFEGMAEGAALCDTGAVGGSWGETPVPEGASAVRVADGETAAIALRSEPKRGVAFDADETAGADAAWAVDLRLRFESVYDCADDTLDTPLAFTLGYDDDDAISFAGWVGDTWHYLTRYALGGAAGAASNVWYDVRIETRTIAGARYAGFSVRDGAGVWTQLAEASGCCWFAIDAEAADAARSVLYSGTGRFSAFSGVRAASSETPLLDWTGGETGDWSEVGNWALSGGGEARVPGPGDAVRFAGTVAITRGKESATVTDATFLVADDGSLMKLGGTISLPLSLDTTRPRVGKALTVVSGTFGGIAPAVTATWYRRRPQDKDGVEELVATGASYTPSPADYTHWIRCVATSETGAALDTTFLFSKFPVLYMKTDDGTAPTAGKEKHAGDVYVQGNADWKSPYDGRMTINVRGNTTAGMSKKPWKLKLDKKTEMFGMTKNKHWVLLADAKDPTDMRNRLAFDLANEVGSQGMDATWVECVLNGAWQGLYLFCEQIRVGKGRVDIFDWEGEADDRGIEGGDTDLSWVTDADDITGGYLFEFDTKSGSEISTFSISAGNTLRIPGYVNTPEYVNTNKRMFDWATGYLKGAFAAMTSVDGYSGGRHYSELADVDSMVGYFFVMEFTGNYDAANNSRFGYIDRGKKLVFGPAWDFDISMGCEGNTWSESAKDPANWTVQTGTGSFFKEWADDPWFCMLLWQRYWGGARAAFVRLIESIDGHEATIHEAAVADAAKWNFRYEAGLVTLRNYVTRRLDWLDEQFADVPTLMASLRDGSGSGSAHPYDRDEVSLAIDFNDDALAPSATVTVKNDAITTVACYLDGLKLGEPRALGTDRTFTLNLPRRRVGTKADSCLALIAYKSDGKTVAARNYRLIRRKEAGFAVIVR